VHQLDFNKEITILKVYSAQCLDVQNVDFFF